MNVAFITNIRAPYRTLQLKEYSKIKNINLTAYYTNKPEDNRTWEVKNAKGFKEIDLHGFKLSKSYGYINKGLLDIVKTNDLIILGGYEQPSIILTSILCRACNKPYVIFFDGISTNRIYTQENKFKKIIKNIVIKNAKSIMANGCVGELYFINQFRYPKESILNQYLAIDNETIDSLYLNKDYYRAEYRRKLNISEGDKVLIYSGRLIDIKNIESVIKAISALGNKNIVFLITGGGALNNKLQNLASELSVRVIITGFMKDQIELFKHYFAGDAFILPSVEEPWGLVVNEAMASGLPVLVSDICGCSLDLVHQSENGYTFNPNDIQEISYYIYKLLFEDDKKSMGYKSREIIKHWNFNNSKVSLSKIIDNIKI